MANGKHLVCDDSSVNRLILRKFLQNSHCLVDEAIDGSDAIDKITLNGEYEIVWMDIKMPKMDGHECTRYLRSKMGYTGKIVCVSGYTDNATIAKCKNLGIDTIIAKPYNFNLVRDLLNVGIAITKPEPILNDQPLTLHTETTVS